MDLPKTLYSLIGVMVAMLVVATVAAPVILDSEEPQEPDRTYTNAGSKYFSDDIDSIQKIELVMGSTLSYKVNGSPISVSVPYDLIGSDAICVSWRSSSSFSVGIPGSDVVLGDNLVIERTGSGWTYTLDENDPVSIHPTWMIYANPNGNLVEMTTGAFVTSLNDVYSFVCGSQGTCYALANGQMAPSSAAHTINSEKVTDGYEISQVNLGDHVRSNFYVDRTIIVSDPPTPNNSLLLVTLTILFVLPVMMTIRILTGRGE